jgi:hypothetical protein
MSRPDRAKEKVFPECWLGAQVPMTVSPIMSVIFTRPVGLQCISIRVSGPTREFACGQKNATPSSPGAYRKIKRV